MAKHTPGPWTYGSDIRGRRRVFSGNYEIVRAMSKNGARVLPATEREANARLIAAAPEMLAALKAIAYEPQGPSDATHEHVLLAVMAIARDAIAKAEGK